MKTLVIILVVLILGVFVLVLYSMFVSAGIADTAAGRQEWQQDMRNKKSHGGAK